MLYGSFPQVEVPLLRLSAATLIKQCGCWVQLECLFCMDYGLHAINLRVT